MSGPAKPDKSKLRACMLCAIVKVRNAGSRHAARGPKTPLRLFQTAAQFKRDGCDNCEDLLHYRGSSANVQQCTTDRFEGLIGLFQPEQSWAARNLSMDKFARGMYAVRIIGRLPEEVEDSLRDQGITVIPRDGSSATEA